MKQIILLLAFSMFLALESRALPLPDGSTAPNFTLTDLNGVSHTLYDYLNQGKTVVIDFSATWCGPCWAYHNTHILKDLYNQKGPPGTNQVMVFFIEGDPSTPVSALYGGSGSQGNWVDGTPYPIMDDGTGQVAGQYQITYFPTLYAICPDKKIYEPGQVPLQTWINWIGSCSMNVTSSIDNADCFGLPGGSIDLTVNGGFGNKTYQWSNGANSQDVYNLMAGNYAVTVADANNRSIALQNLIVTSPTAIVPTTVSVTHVTCNGANNGSATVNASGGIPGYTYTWDTGASGATGTNLSGGMHNVTVKDANNCTKVHSVMINEPAVLNGVTQTTGANCGDNDGLVTITPSGGTFPYTFNIGNGPQSAPVFLNLYAGNYSVTITDFKNCTKVLPFTIPDLPGPAASAGPDKMITCGNAQVTLDGTGSGSGNNILYQWTTTDGHIVSGANTKTPVVDMPGTYSLTVTNTQTECANTDAALVSQDLENPIADAGPDGVLDCNLPELILDGSASSQGAEFVYLWTTSDGNIVSGENTLYPLVNASGTYTLTVTDTVNMCDASDMVVVTANQDGPVADAGPDGALGCTVFEVILDGSGSASGSNIFYNWTTADGNIVSGETTLNPVVNAPGTYVLEVADIDNGCSSTDEVVVTQDQVAPVADAGPDGVINCANAELTLDGAGSSSGVGITYQWSTPDGNIVSGGDTPTPVVDAPGTYTLAVTNTDNGCVTSDDALVSEDLALPLADAGVGGEIDCVTSELTLDGSASSQGVEFIYLWTTPDGNIVSGETTLTPLVNAEGTYTLTVTNTVNACEASSSVVVTANQAFPVANGGPDGRLDCIVTELTLDGSGSSSGSNIAFLWTTEDGNIVSGATTPTPLVNAGGTYVLRVSDTESSCSLTDTVVVVQDQVIPTANAGSDGVLICGDTELTLDGTASSTGTAYAYLWSTPDGIIVSGGDSPTPLVSGPGTYSLAVTNTENGCLASDEALVTEVPVVDGFVETFSDITCWGNQDGTATLTALNGTQPYAFSWPGGLSGPTQSGLAAGTYIVTITDADNCTDLVTVEILEPALLVANASATGETSSGANDGTASANPSGGVEPYHFLWSNGETTAAISGLAPGNYTVSIVDDNGCTTEETVTVSSFFCNISLIIDVLHVTCNGAGDGQATVNISDGLEPFEIQWSDGQSGPTASGLTPGTYTVSVVDKNFCTASSEFTVEEPSVLELSLVEATDANCFGEASGAATVAASGGTGSHSYLWPNGKTEPFEAGLAAGDYTVTATDENGCETTLTVSIGQPGQLTGDLVISAESAYQSEDGAITVNPAGGIPGYQLLWSNGETTATIEGLAPGEYTVVITDDHGCTVELSGVVEEYVCPQAALETSVVTVSCNGSADGEASLLVSGGTEPYIYAWSNSETSPVITGLLAGLYEVTVQDGANCTYTAQVEVPEPDVLSLEVTEQSDIDCPGGSNGSATVAGSGGTPGYEYFWSTGETGPTASGLASGLYHVTVLDANGCASSLELEILDLGDNIPPTIVIEESIFLVLDENGNGSITAEMLDAGTYDNCGLESIAISQASFDCSNLGENIVTFTALDVNGNENTGLASVFVEDKIDPEISCPENIVVFNCDGLVEYATPSASDNCGQPSVELIGGLGSGANFPVGTTTELWQATDASGNSAECFFTVTVMNTLETGISATSTCPGMSQGSASVIVTGGTPGYTYQWSNGGDTEMISGLSAGVYTVIVKDATGCELSATIEVVEYPAVEFVVDEVIDEVNSGQNGAIKVSTVSGSAPFIYEWQDELGNVVSNQEDLVDVPAGAYRLFVTDSNGCTFSSDWITVDNILGTNDPSWSAGVWVYPNPAKDRVNLRIQLDEAASVQMEVFDMNGISMAKIQTASLAQHEREITTGQWASGVYFLRIVVRDEVLLRKLIIE